MTASFILSFQENLAHFLLLFQSVRAISSNSIDMKLPDIILIWGFFSVTLE